MLMHIRNNIAYFKGFPMETTFLSTLVIAIAIIIIIFWSSKTKPVKKTGEITIEGLDTIATQLKVINTNGQVELLDAKADLDFANSEAGKRISAGLAEKKMLARAKIKIQELKDEAGTVTTEDLFAEHSESDVKPNTTPTISNII